MAYIRTPGSTGSGVVVAALGLGFIAVTIYNGYAGLTTENTSTQDMIGQVIGLLFIFLVELFMVLFGVFLAYEASDRQTKRAVARHATVKALTSGTRQSFAGVRITTNVEGQELEVGFDYTYFSKEVYDAFEPGSKLLALIVKGRHSGKPRIAGVIVDWSAYDGKMLTLE